MFMKFKKLLSDRVLVLPDEPENVTKGGIYLPDTAKERPRRGVVVAIGPGKRCDQFPHERHAMSVQVGDVVLFTKYSGADVEINGTLHRIMEENEVIGVLESNEGRCTLADPKCVEHEHEAIIPKREFTKV